MKTPIEKAGDALRKDGVLHAIVDDNSLRISVKSAHKVYRETIEDFSVRNARHFASKAAGVPLILASENDEFVVLQHVADDRSRVLSPYDDFVSRFVREHEGISDFVSFWGHVLGVNSYVFRPDGTVQEWLTEKAEPKSPALVSDGILRQLPDGDRLCFFHVRDPEDRFLSDETLMGTLPETIEASWHKAIHDAVDRLLGYTVQEAMRHWLNRRHRYDDGRYMLPIFDAVRGMMEGHLESKKNLRKVANILSRKYGMKFLAGHAEDDIDAAVRLWVEAKYVGYKAKKATEPKLSPVEAALKRIEADYISKHGWYPRDGLRMSRTHGWA
jgi:hypothetical protein